MTRHDRGLLIEQRGECYIAKGWALTEELRQFFNTALTKGFGCIIRDNHPLKKNRGFAGNGVVHISFSRVPDELWIFGLSNLNYNLRKFLVNGKSVEIIKRENIPSQFEGRNPQGGAHVVSMGLLGRTLDALAQA